MHLGAEDSCEHSCRRKLSAALQSLNGEGNRAIAASTVRLSADDDAILAKLLGEDVPVELQLNPFDPYTVERTQPVCPVRRPYGNAAEQQDGAQLTGGVHTSAEPCASAQPEAASAEEFTVRCGNASREIAYMQPAPSCSTVFQGAISHSSNALSDVHSLADIDMRLMDLALDHDWDDSCSLTDFGQLGDPAVRTLRSSVASATRSIMGSLGAASTSSIAVGSTACGTGTSAAHDPSVVGSASEGTSSLDPETGPAIGGAGASVASSTISTAKQSKHDATDYLRPMREERELENLCAPAMPRQMCCAEPCVAGWNAFSKKSAMCLDILLAIRFRQRAAPWASAAAECIRNPATLQCRSLQVDREVRKLRESALPTPTPAALQAMVQACQKQQEQYKERCASGSMASSWLRTPRLSLAGSSTSFAGHSMGGATSLAGPCLDTGDRPFGRLSPIPEQTVGGD